MKVAFWSSVRGKSCVTSNLACMGILASLDSANRQRKTILFENHHNLMNLESSLFSEFSDDQVREECQYEGYRGMEEVLYAVEKGHIYSSREIFQNARGCLGEKLFYLPQKREGNPDIFEYRMSRDCQAVLQYLERYNDLVMIDTSCSFLNSSRRILEEADLVVVNLFQNEAALSHFFSNYSNIRKKAFYLIGNYEGDSCMTRGEILKRYRIPGSHLGVIPFFLRLYRGEGKKEDRVFWEQITEAYRLLSNVMERKEEKVYYA